MPPTSKPSAKHIGRWVAAGAVLIAMAIVAAMMIFSKPSKPDPRDALPMPPDITSRPMPLTDGPSAGAGEGTVLQFLDKQNPNREAGRLLVEKMEPLEARRFLLENPRILIFLKDGRTAHIRADTGRFYMPARDQPPESGLLEGAGLVRLYPPKPDGLPIDVEADTPIGTMEFKTLTFDMTLGEVSTDDRVIITSDQLDFAGSGIRVFIDQTRERLARAEVRQGEYIRFRPSSDGGSSPAGAASNTRVARPSGAAFNASYTRAPRPSEPTPNTSSSALPPNQSPQDPVESRYYAVFAGDVKVTRDAMLLTGDRLDVWVRLFDNRLRDGAIAPVNVAKTTRRAASPSEPSILPVAAPRRAQQTRAAIQPQTAPQPEAAPSPLTLTWSGPLVVTPRDDVPKELTLNDVALRLTADATGLVRFRDDESKAEGHCSVLEYAATTRRLNLSGPGPVSVALQSPTLGRIESVRVAADLATGIVHIPTPGIARSHDRAQRISWTDQADLQFRIEDDALSGLRTAIFQGDVRAADAGSTLDTSYLRTEFQRLDDGSSSLSHLYAEGGFEAIGPHAQTLRGQTAEVRFKPAIDGEGNHTVDPTSLIADGGVFARNDTTTITAQHLEADLIRDESGSVTIGDRAMATGEARFVQAPPRGPRVEATAEEIIANPVAEHVTFFAAEGAHASVTRGHTRIAGSQIALDGRKRTVWVVGEGTLDHDVIPPPAEADAVHTVHAAWTREMRLDDLTGQVECLGEVVARAEGPRVLDTLTAERVLLELEPADNQDAPTLSADRTTPSDEPPSGRLLRAHAEGASLHVDGGHRAKIEVRRYDPASATRRLERLFYLEGDRIHADNTDQTLTVPGPGRLLLVDRRSQAPQPSDNPAVPPPQGSTRFDWLGSMKMDRTQGRATMRDMVQLTHKPWPTGDLVFLESEQLIALVREQPHDDPRNRQAAPEQLSGELISANATGAVYVRSATREMIADSLIYDAQTGIAVAAAAPGNLVTMYEAARGAVYRAARLRWDLIKDEIRVERAEPLTVPHAGP